MKILRIFLVLNCLTFLQAETVVCSFAILKDLCAQICEGTEIEVLTIVPNSVDPHLYQSKPSDSKMIAKANLVITNGLNLEGWIGGIISASGYNGTVLLASTNIKPRYLGTLPDPHIWHSPKLIIQMIDNITNGLSVAFPRHKPIFTKNSIDLKKSFQMVEAKITKLFVDIPENKRIMLTTHDAFFYFSMNYNIKVLSPQGISTGDDPSAADMKNLINQIRDLNISAIFLENLSNHKIINIISEETGKSVKGILFADTLKENSSLQETLMYNATTIAKAILKGEDSNQQDTFMYKLKSFWKKITS
ncbi:MAG: metal ABC transporter substrate-binding protein [Proteobacteria bacterium]|nr:metal ABC transporter substrate-binding protein [Pseudomonadota bacterium]